MTNSNNTRDEAEDTIIVHSSPAPKPTTRPSLQNLAPNIPAPAPVKRGPGRPRKDVAKAADFRSPSGVDSAKDLKADLAELGFSKQEVKRLAGVKECTVDGTGQFPNGQTREQRERERERFAGRGEGVKRERVGQRERGKEKERYEPLFLGEEGRGSEFCPVDLNEVLAKVFC